MKKTFKFGLSLALCTFLAACAYSGYRPIVDGQGQNMANYEYDLAQCQNLARQHNPATETAKQAGIGALLGTAVGAIYGNSRTTYRGAATGAILGGASGAITSDGDQRQIIVACMRGRGYRVIR